MIIPDQYTHSLFYIVVFLLGGGAMFGITVIDNVMNVLNALGGSGFAGLVGICVLLSLLNK